MLINAGRVVYDSLLINGGKANRKTVALFNSYRFKGNIYLNHRGVKVLALT